MLNKYSLQVENQSSNKLNNTFKVYRNKGRAESWVDPDLINSKAMHALFTIPCGFPEKTASSPSTPSLPNTYLPSPRALQTGVSLPLTVGSCSLRMPWAENITSHAGPLQLHVLWDNAKQENSRMHDSTREQPVESNGSQCVIPRPIASAPSGNLSEVHILGLHPSSTESETVEWGLAISVLISPPRWFWCSPKFENYLSSRLKKKG